MRRHGRSAPVCAEVSRRTRKSLLCALLSISAPAENANFAYISSAAENASCHTRERFCFALTWSIFTLAALAVSGQWRIAK